MSKEAIKLDYLNGLSLRALAAKYHIPKSTLAEWANKENWPRPSARQVRAVNAGQRHAASSVRMSGQATNRVSAGGQRKPVSELHETSPETKPIRGSRHAPPTNAFAEHNTVSRTHGGYSRRMRFSADIRDEIKNMTLRDELEAVRGSNLLVASEIGRIRTLLQLERDPELKAALQEELRQAENALHRNIARIESLEKNIVFVEHTGSKMTAETERSSAQGEKTRLEAEILGKQSGGHLTPLGEIIAEIHKMEHSGLINTFPEDV